MEDVMESFSKFASRIERNINRVSSERSASDRARAERYDREYSERRRPASVNLEQIKDAVNNSNENQLDVIQDFFDDSRVEQDASNKEILRAVDSNAKLINKGVRLISDFRDEWEDEERIDYKALSDANKEEILKAVFSNAEILKLLKEELVENKEVSDEVFSKSQAEKMYADLEDHVHKENVKCYRNVQAVITEQDAQTYSKIKKGLGAVKGLVITAIIFGAANLAFLVCQYLKLI